MALNMNYRCTDDSLLLIDSQRFEYQYKAGKTQFIGQTQVHYDSIQINPDFPKNHFGLELSRT